MTQSLTISEVFAFRNAQEPKIAPDATRLCFLLLRRDLATDRRRTSLMLQQDGAEDWTELADSDGAQSPVWAPDSRRLAFLRKTAGGTSLLVLDCVTGQTTTVTAATVSLRDPTWSRDGTHLAWQQFVPAADPDWLDVPTPPEGADWAPRALLTERLVYRHDLHGDLRDGVFQVFVAAAEGGGAARQLTTGDWHGGFVFPSGLTWSADGSEVLLVSNRRPDWDTAPNETDLFAVRLADGAVRQLTDRRGPVALPALSPDGSQVAFTAVEWAGLSAHARHVYLMDVAGGPARRIAPELDRSIDGLAWRDAATLLVSYDEAGEKLLARLDVASGTVTPLLRDMGGSNIESPYSSGTFAVARDGSVVTTCSTAALPCEVVRVAPDGQVRVLTALNAALAARVGGFVPAESFWVRSHLDGAAIQCWLQRPRGASGPVPLILSIHGGPFSCFGDRFSIKHQCFLAAGYAVLTVNPRGSIGYGEDFANLLHDAHPGPDWHDLMDAVDAAVTRDGIDGAALFVTGTSGGGVLTLWSVTHSQRFRAAVSVKPVVNQESWMLTADIGAMLGTTWFAGVRPWDRPEKFRARSPLAFVHQVRTPTLLIAGEADHRTPSSESQQMYSALRLCGVEAALMRMPGVPHTTQAMRPSHFAAEIGATLSWFARHAGG
jgi:dipeptidyl aminopeptidase/acylaminoacyl peptidase